MIAVPRAQGTRALLVALLALVVSIGCVGESRRSDSPDTRAVGGPSEGRRGAGADPSTLAGTALSAAAADTSISAESGRPVDPAVSAETGQPEAGVDPAVSAETGQPRGRAGASAPHDTSADAGPMIHPRPADLSTSGAPDSAAWTTGVAFAPPTGRAPPLPVLGALRTGTHPAHERMVIEVRAEADGLPSYRVEYVDRPLIECGSGRQIFPVGDAWLEVRLEPAAAHDEAGQPTLGDREIAVDGPLLLRVYRTCNFEGVVTLVMALARPNPFRVFTLSDPGRIVVDVQR